MRFAKAIFAAVVVFAVALILNLNGVGFNRVHEGVTMNPDTGVAMINQP